MGIHIINPDKSFTPLLTETLEHFGFETLDVDELNIPKGQEDEAIHLIQASAIITISSGFSQNIWNIINTAENLVVFDMRVYLVRKYLRNLIMTNNISSLLDNSLDEYTQHIQSLENIFHELEHFRTKIKVVTVDWKKFSIANPTGLFSTISTALDFSVK